MQRRSVRRLVIGLAIVGAIGVVAWLPPVRTRWQRSLSQWQSLNPDDRAKLLVRSALVGGDAGIERACELMLADPEDSYSLTVLEYLWDAQSVQAHAYLAAWLDDDRIAWPGDPRKIRRCDLAAHYFRMWIGDQRWAPARALEIEVAPRNKFREEVRKYVQTNGLPGGS